MQPRNEMIRARTNSMRLLAEHSESHQACRHRSWEVLVRRKRIRQGAKLHMGGHEVRLTGRSVGALAPGTTAYRIPNRLIGARSRDPEDDPPHLPCQPAPISVHREPRSPLQVKSEHCAPGRVDMRESKMHSSPKQGI